MLFEACKNLEIDQLRSIIDGKADINIVNKFSQTPLLYLFSAYPNIDTEEEAKISMAMMKLLIEKGAKLDIKDSLGKSFLDRVNTWNTSYTRELSDFIQAMDARQESLQLNSTIGIDKEYEQGVLF